MIDQSMIEKLAKLSLLTFNDDEFEEIKEDINSIISFVGRLQELDTNLLEGSGEKKIIVEMNNCFNEDEVRPSLSSQEAVKNSKTHSEGEFVIKKVL